MKLLVITHSYYPAFSLGGPIQSLHALNKELVKLGMEVSVITTNAGLEDRNEIPVRNWTSLDGVEVKYFPYYGGRLYNVSPHMAVELFEIIKEFNLVYITPVWNFPNLIGAVMSHIYKKPYIISPRGTLYKETIELKSSILKKMYYRLIVKYMLKHSYSLHFTTEDEKNKVIDYLEIDKSNFVMPNGMDFKQFEVLPPKNCFKKKYPQLINKRIVLFLGRINEKKGLDILVDAFETLSQQHEDLFLVIAGFDNDSYLKNVKDLINKTSVSNKVVIPGPLVGKSKLEAYVDTDLFVLPSYSENFGMAVIEAMACNCPVVISDKVGISPEVEDKNAGAVVECNTHSLHNGMEKMLSNKELAKTCSVNAKKYVEETFNIEVVASNMLSRFEQIVSFPS